ncbi:MAG: archaetidylserine decarboxylase [Gammaproteobacteria bacterium]
MLARLWWLLQLLLPQFWLGNLMHGLADSTSPWIKQSMIRYWLFRYPIDMQEAQRQHPDDYVSFTDFFTRTLKVEARPQPEDPQVLMSPVDGALLSFGNLGEGWLVQSKGQLYSLSSLLGLSQKEAKRFHGCDYASFYLSPKDYHRVHMPLSGRLMFSSRLPGALYSVNKLSHTGIPRLLARNRRCACVFSTESGEMAVVLVGALMVGAIKLAWEREPLEGRQDWDRRIQVDRDAEIGRFELGSAVVLIAPPDYRMLEHLQAGQSIRKGDALAVFKAFSN